MANNYDLTQTGPEVQGILNKANPMPSRSEYDATIQGINTAIAGKVDKAVSVTYAALKALRDGGTLVPGQLYRITDYVTTVAATIDDNCGEQLVRSAGHQFDLLVRADSVSTLNEQAWAVQHDGDTYFQNARLEAWQLKYCLDNDTARFDWADTEQGKGVIYEMQDEWKNVLPYDFKNIQFKRFAIMGQSHLYVNSDYPTEMDDDGYVTDVIGAKLTINTLNPTDQQRLGKLGAYLHPFQGYYSEQYIYDDGYSDSWDGLELEDGGTRLFAMVTDNFDSYGILAEVDKTKAVWCHTFGKVTAFTQGETEDVSLTGRTMDFKMSPYIVSNGKTGLHASVMVSNQNYQYRNSKITGVFTGNTISGNIQYTSISGYIQYTSISGEIYRTSISGYIYALSVSGYIEYTSISGSIGSTSVSGYIERTSISGNINALSVSGNIQYTSISGEIYRTSISGEIYRTSISGNFRYSSVSGYIECTSISGSFNYTSVSGNFRYSSVSGEIYYTSVSGSITYATIKGYCYYLLFPALQHCIVAGNLPEGDGWDSLLEVDFSGEDYEQVITRNADDEIVVRPLYAI